MLWLRFWSACKPSGRNFTASGITTPCAASRSRTTLAAGRSGLDGYFDLGVTVTGVDGRNYELSARLRWSRDEWVVQADASQQQEDERVNWCYPVLRELPERRAPDWPTALEHWRAAVADLAGFDDLIPAVERAP